MKNNSKIRTVNSLVRENVKALKPYVSARDDFNESENSMIYLDANENPNNTGINRYPDPQHRNLKSLIASIKNVSVKNILIGNGSDELLDIIFRTFCEPYKDSVITLPPTYGMYSVLSGINAVENKEVLLNEDLQPNVKAIMDKIELNTKIIFLCTPNNPTGNSFSNQKVLEILESFSGLVVIDEAYIDFSEEVSWLSRLEEFPNLVITQTLSKAYGAAGIRMGICFASPEIIAILNKIKPPYNCNSLSQERAIRVMSEKDMIKRQIALIKEERANLFSALLKIKFVSKIYESDANFLLIKVDDANQRYKQLLDKGFVVRNRSSQPLCENTLRITIGTREENKKLIQTLQQL